MKTLNLVKQNKVKSILKLKIMKTQITKFKNLFLFIALMMGMIQSNAQCTGLKANFTNSTYFNKGWAGLQDSSQTTGYTGLSHKITWGDGLQDSGSSVPTYYVHSTYTQRGLKNVCLTIKGMNGATPCSSTKCKTLFVGDSTELTLYNKTNPACGSCNGKLTLNGFYPNTAMVLKWYNLNGSTIVPNTTYYSDSLGRITLSNLCAGSYNNFYFQNLLYIYDHYTFLYNGAPPVILSGSGLLSSHTITQPTTSANGSITTSVTGGVGSKTYLWKKNGVNFATTANISGLGAGTYCLHIADSSGCAKDTCITLSAPTSPCAALNAIQYTVNNFSTPFGGSIISTNNSTNNIYYSWTQNSTYYGNTQSISYLYPSTYCLHLVDSTTGCVKDTCFSITGCYNFIAAGSMSQPQAVSGTNGSAYCYPYNSLGNPMTITWNKNGVYYASGNSISNLGVGTYCVHVVDTITGCFADSCVTMYAAPAPCSINIIGFGWANATSGNNGFLNPLVFNTVGQTTYLWKKNGVNYATTKNISGLSAGTYCMFVTDSFCTRDTCMTLTGPANPCLISVDNMSLLNPTNGNNGYINIAVAGNTGPVSYLWKKNGLNFATTKNISGLGAGTYCLHIVDTVECSQDTCFTLAGSTSPCASVKALFTSSKVLKTVTFTNTSTHIATAFKQYYWTFGDGADAFIMNAAHTYAAYGTYKVKLYIFDYADSTMSTLLCKDTLAQNITLTPPCVDSAKISPSTVCPSYISPVCACNNKTYINSCEAGKAGVTAYTFGPCPNDTNYVTICGYVIGDKNKNCVKDSTEAGLKNVKINLAGNLNTIFTLTDAYGYFKFIVAKGQYTITQVLTAANNPKGYKQICPTNNNSIIVNGYNGGQTYCNNTFFDSVFVCNDLKVTMTTLWNSSPGFPRRVKITYTNVSASAIANVVIGYKHDILDSFKSATPTQSTKVGNVLTWNRGTLNANQSGFIIVNLKTKVTRVLGSIVKDSAWILPSLNDCVLSNNATTLIDTTSGSWDPNDLTVTPKGFSVNGNIYKEDKELRYVLHFQNEGTAEAKNIVVLNTPNANFDLSTLKIEDVSHQDYNLNITKDGKIIFEFPGINLPAKEDDEEGSNGYIEYTIQVKDGANVGDVMLNQGDIYFDFNTGVLTNQTKNTIVEKTSAVVEVGMNTMNVTAYPNPIVDYTYIHFDSEVKDNFDMIITDITGKVVYSINQSIELGSQDIKLDINHLTKGVYLFNVFNQKGMNQTIKLVKE
jgi:hypothetical protein